MTSSSSEPQGVGDSQGPTEDLVAQLRHHQRAGEFAAVQAIVARHPALAAGDGGSLSAILALVALLQNDSERGQRYLDAVDPAALSDAPSLSDYGLACWVCKRMDPAEMALVAALQAPEVDGVAYARLAALRLFQGHLDEAEALYQTSLDRDPERAEVYNNLAEVKFRRGQLNEALELYNRALSLKPDLAPSRAQRLVILKQLGQLEQLLEDKQSALERQPDDSDLHADLAEVQIQSQQLAEAQATLEAAVARFADDERLHRLLIQLLFRRRRWQMAGKQLLKWCDNHPDDLESRLLLNQARLEADFLAAAAADLETLAEMAANWPRYHLLKAKLLDAQGQVEAAIGQLEQTVARFPGLVEAHIQLGHLLTTLGRLEAASGHFHRAARLRPSAVLHALESQAEAPTEAQLALLHHLVDSPRSAPEQRSAASFALGRALEKAKNYDASFRAIHRANELVKDQLGYDWTRHRRLAAATVEVFTPALLERFKGAGSNSCRPIFILGMPRSGTTLVEQILASHPAVFAAGELSWVPRLSRLMLKVVKGQALYPRAMNHLKPHQLNHAAEYYLDKLQRLDFLAPHVTDKLPHNFDHLGFIATMFPRAKIIHLQRDPRDVAVSNYYQNFAAAQGLMGFAYDLTWIGEMINDHDHLMAHWRQLFSGRIFELDYQRLVEDPEAGIAALLDYCELPWDDQVLRFYETQRPVKTASIRQVRQGVYRTSKEKWRRYQAHLGELDAALARGFQPPPPLDKPPAAHGSTGI
ncbi:MAG: sulfotransferase [Candidatus Competibacterales bacterium]